MIINVQKYLLTSFVLLISIWSYGQPNMVSNPSFEERWEAPFTMNQLKFTKEWSPFGTADPSPDYFHAACVNETMGVPNNLFGRQMARTGEAYIGLITYLTSKSGRGWRVPQNHREFVMISLTKPLVAGHQYYAEMYVNLADNCEFATDNLGFFFTKNMPSFDWQVMNFHHYKAQVVSTKGEVIDDNEEWQKVSGTFIAKGDEMALTIGSFAPDSAVTHRKTRRKFSHQRDKQTPKNLQPQIAYYLIDDVLVRPIDPNESIYPPLLADIPTKKDSFGLIEIGKKIVLKNIYFAFDKTTLLSPSFFELNKLFAFMQDNKHLKIQISGHTDNVGSQAYNINLSTGRAQAVVNFLIAKGINTYRLRYKGYGSNVPIVPNNTFRNQALNRRVEFEILEK